jgi:murein DD-endopeptidase MepM/ murein hydrolase activator NlpD
MKLQTKKWAMLMLLIAIAFGVAAYFLISYFNKQVSVENTNNEKSILDSSLADGFDFPFGDGNGGGDYRDVQSGKKYSGWYVATSTGELYDLGIHTGEDWNGKGGGNTDFGQPVYATAKGTVKEAKDFGAPWGNVVYIEHSFQENGNIKKVFSLYAHLNEIKTEKGKTVARGEKIGTVGDGHKSFPSHLHFEIRKPEMESYAVTYWPSSENKSVQWVKEHYYSPSNFISARRKLIVPMKERNFLHVVKHDYKMNYYSNGKLKKTFEIALSQNPNGPKQKQGDNKMPEGEYRIIQKSRGPFSGPVAKYFGPAWMRLNYPNNYDAERGVISGLISKEEYNSIVKPNNSGREPNKNTALGGGIGIHGWNGSWPLNFRDLTWGCVSMRNDDLDEWYSKFPEGTLIIIQP